MLKNCKQCNTEFNAFRKEYTMCSKECTSKFLANRQVKYTEEDFQKAIALKLKGIITSEIVVQTGIKKPTLMKLFKERNIKLTQEQIKENTARRWANHEPIKDGKKECSKCGILKSIEEFHKHKDTITGLVSSCIDCSKEFYKDNSEVIKERVTKYRTENLEKIAETSVQYYEKNKEHLIIQANKWATENPEKRKTIEKKWRQENKEHRRAKLAMYRAKKKGATPAWITEEQIKQIEEIYLSCPEGYEVDHIIPINGDEICGLHLPWNLQHLPKYQNGSKGNILVQKNEVKECHQYNRKIQTEEEDRLLGRNFNHKIDDAVLSYEELTKEHKEFIEKYEWLGTIGYAPKWAFAARFNGILGGLVLISEPNGYVRCVNLEALISRGATASWAPHNLGSKLIMFACNWMTRNTTKKVFFGYSDHEAGEIGTIYQSCNFKYLGSHFGARTNFILKSGKSVTSRYFTKTSTRKRYAKELGIAWLPEWGKENGYQNISAIPDSVIFILNKMGEKEKLESKKINILPKGKYVLFNGYNSKDKENITKEYKKIFGEFLPYPKRS